MDDKTYTYTLVQAQAKALLMLVGKQPCGEVFGLFKTLVEQTQEQDPGPGECMETINDIEGDK